jgi:hypothetical protein
LKDHHRHWISQVENPSKQLQRKLGCILGWPGKTGSFRVLNGDVSKALSRVAENTGASLVIIDPDRPRPLARVDGVLEGSVPASLTHQQRLPVLIVPELPGSLHIRRRPR